MTEHKPTHQLTAALSKNKMFFIVIIVITFAVFILVVSQTKESPKPMTFTYVAPSQRGISRFNVLDRLAITNYGHKKLFEEFDPTNYKEIGRRIRLLSEVQPIGKDVSELSKLLTTQIFGFIEKKYDSINSLYNSFKDGGKGIVITTGNRFFPFTVHLIRTIRLLGCHLPIEIWHFGPKDLSPRNAAFMETLEGVKVGNILEHFPIEMELWDIKPFAVLASRFSEVILMDADCIFVQNPENLFKDHEYVQTGTLFFNDRSLFPGDWEKSHWILDLFPAPHSIRVQNLRMLQAKTLYELESGVVLMDKRRHFWGMLSVCLLNCPGPLKQNIRDQTHGDKETFWIGLEMAGEKYAFMPQLPGSIGVVHDVSDKNEKEICGKLTHFDRNGELLWFNDGIAMSKTEGDATMSELSDLTHYGKEVEGRWELCCLRGKFHEIPLKTMKTLEEIKQLYVFDPIAETGKGKAKEE